MTSLTGCAGESFASILRSLGFESHRVKKADYEAALRKPAETPAAVAAPTQDSEARENRDLSAELASDGEPTATAPWRISTRRRAEALPVSAEPAAIATAPLTEEAEAAEPPEPAPEAAETRRAAAPSRRGAAQVETGEAAAAPPVEDEWVEIWRPAPRRRPSPPRRDAPAGVGEAAGRPARAAHGSRRRHGRDRDATAPAPAAEGQAAASRPEAPSVVAAEEGPREGRREGAAAHRHGGRRQFAFKGSGNEQGRAAEGGRPPREPNPLASEKGTPCAACGHGFAVRQAAGAQTAA